MSNASTPQKPTIARAIYKRTETIQRLLEPIAVLAAKAADPVQLSPIDTLIETQQQILQSLEQVRLTVEAVHARLDEPAVVRAIKEALQT